MNLNDKNINGLNYAIEDLDIDELGCFSMDEFIRYDGSEYCDIKLLSACKILLEKLNFHLEQKILVPNDNCLMINDLYDIIIPLHPNFKHPTKFIAYRIIHLLVTSLQSERFNKLSHTGSLRREIASQRGIIAFQLEKLAKEIDPAIQSNNEIESVTKICDKLNFIKNQCPQAFQTSPVKIISKEIRLNNEESNTFTEISNTIHQDYALRRKMLLQRLDVTLESFLYGEKAQSKEGEIVAAIKGQRSQLFERQIKYSLDDIFDAPISILYENSKKVTDASSAPGVKSLVKSILVGNVPDRGGRTGDTRPKLEKSSFGGRGAKPKFEKKKNHGNNSNSNNNNNNNEKSEEQNTSRVVYYENST